MAELLTRSEYCLNIRCPRLLWLARYGGTSDEFTEWSLNETFNKVAVNEFSSKFDGCEFITEENINMAAAKTAMALAKTKNPPKAISGAAFTAGPLSCRCDLIKKNDDGTYTVYIIRAATHLRQIYCHDGAYQIFILQAKGLTVSNVIFVHIDPDYVCGESDPEKKYVEERITPRTKSQLNSVEKRAVSALQVLKMEEFPDVEIHNSCFVPLDCECRGECMQELPEKNIFDMSGVSRVTKFKLYHQGNFTLEELTDEPQLTDDQIKRIKMYLNGDSPVINQPELKKFLSTLWYPAYFLDFESMQLPFPIFSGTRPYEQVAFQYSLHHIDEKGGEVRYTSFISPPGEDPRRKMAERLTADIPDDACVIVYNNQLENKVLETLAKMYPDLRRKLLRIRSHVRDISVPFEKKYYYDPKTLGGNSLKVVSKAIFPDDGELDYKGLEGVHNGKEAAVAYATITAGTGDADSETVIRELLDYCSIDTLALVKILKKLEDSIE